MTVSTIIPGNVTAQAANATSVSITISAGAGIQEGDLMIVAAQSDYLTGSLTPPAGFTLRTQRQVSGGFNMKSHLLSRIADGSENGATLTISQNRSEELAMCLWVFRSTLGSFDWVSNSTVADGYNPPSITEPDPYVALCVVSEFSSSYNWAVAAPWDRSAHFNGFSSAALIKSSGGTTDATSWDNDPIGPAGSYNCAVMSVFEEAGGGADVTAPVLTSPTASATGETTADVSVSTDEGNGILYWVATQSATAPTDAQVKNGADHTGAPADVAGSSNVSATGAQSVSVTTLTGGTSYYVHLMQEDTSQNASAVVSTAQFTTTAPDTTPPVLTTPTGTVTGDTTATCSVDTDEGNGTLYMIVTEEATLASAPQITLGTDSNDAAAVYDESRVISAAGVESFSVTGLSASTTYNAQFSHRDAAGNEATPVQSVSFTTDAAPDTTAPILSAPTATATGTSSADFSVTTDESNGTLYMLVSPLDVAPSVAQIQAGEDSSGGTPVLFEFFEVLATGAQLDTTTILQPGSTYYTYFQQQDLAGNDSAVVAASAFTTDAAQSDTTPPALSAGSAVPTGSQTATISVSSNESNGTLYWILSTSSTLPSVAEIQAGQASGGGAAARDGSQPVTVTGGQPAIDLTGLAPGTTYYAFFQQIDAAGNDSAVEATGALAMPAAATIITPPIKRNTGSVITNQTGLTVYIYDIADGSVVDSLTGQASNGSGQIELVSGSLIGGISYRIVIVHPDGTEGVATVTA